MPQGLMLTDLAIAGALLLIAKVLRVNIPLLQRLYLPSAVLAGLLGLLFGPAILNVLPWTQTFSHNASLLTAALFSALGLATDLPRLKLLPNVQALSGRLTRLLRYLSGCLPHCLVWA